MKLSSNKVYSIYLINNKVNNKKYIGFTSYKNPKRRFYEHVSCSKDPKYALHRSIKKYGKNNFTFDIICQSLDGKYLLKQMEPYFIKRYNTFGRKGYNMTKGGDGVIGLKNTKLRKKQQLGKNNIIHNPKTKQKMIDSLCKITYKITKIDGSTVIFKNLNRFCKDYNYSRGYLRDVWLGIRSKHKDIIKIERLNINY